jgi:hypothetical protein
MKKLDWWVGLVFVAILVTACGPSGPIVEVSAADINLTVGDLAEGFVVEQEMGFEELLQEVRLEDAGATQDAHMRLFADSGTQVFSAVFVFDSAKNAQSGMEDARRNFELALQENTPGLSFEELISPAIGDEVVLTGANAPEEGGTIHMLTFRELNVVGMLVVVGPAGDLNEDWLGDLGVVLFKRIPQPEESS